MPLEKLLGLLCPAVVLINDGLIVMPEVLQEHFGVGVTTVLDLPTQDTRECERAELSELLVEVQASEIPAKRTQRLFDFFFEWAAGAGRRSGEGGVERAWWVAGAGLWG